MENRKQNLDNWPCGFTGEPVMKGTEDALKYAQLIYDVPDKQDQLVSLRKAFIKTCLFCLNRKDPEFDVANVLAAKAQLFRECLEECKRLQEEKA